MVYRVAASVENLLPRDRGVSRSPWLAEIAKLKTEFGQLDAAIFAYRQYLQNNPDDSSAYHALGDLFKQQKKWTDAENAYRQAIALNPEFFWSYQNLADVLRQQQKWTDAETAYRQAIALNPEFFWSYHNLADVLQKQKKWTEAENVYRDAIALDSDNVESYLGLGETLDRQQKFEAVIPIYRTANRLRVARHYPYLNGDRTSWKAQPHFIAIGCQKGGTTSLFYYLEQHPQILLSVKKEIQFWSLRYDRGLDWYLSHFPELPSDGSILTGEASPTYLDFPEAAERLQKFFPDVRLILLLRNPTDRAISHYYHWRKKGRESRNLEEAIVQQIENFNTRNSGFRSKDNYVVRGIYIKLIQPWLEKFRENILILKSESFYKDTDRQINKVCDFLKISSFNLKQKKIYNSGDYRIENTKIREYLNDFYKPYNLELEKILKYSLNWN
ncbi:hypothetical protein AY599_10540 [Leptolyngbya valderiana BDU 20041]|nr:hypothetical protein AY599_10540 [Leptolyngbya valderiana BDU 20041]